MSRKVLQQSLFRKVMNSFKCLQSLKGYNISQTDFLKIFIGGSKLVVIDIPGLNKVGRSKAYFIKSLLLRICNTM